VWRNCATHEAILQRQAGPKIDLTMGKWCGRMASTLRMIKGTRTHLPRVRRFRWEVIHVKRAMWLNIFLGLWLMISPFILVTLNHTILLVLWEDLLLGFGIATFSLCRLLARRTSEIAFADWFLTALGLLTLINPFLYRYFNMKMAAWNNLAIGGIILLLAIFQDWQDSDSTHWQPGQHIFH